MPDCRLLADIADGCRYRGAVAQRKLLGLNAVAVVDGNGLVTAYAKGKAKITVMTYNKKKATITVIVTE